MLAKRDRRGAEVSASVDRRRASMIYGVEI
jgi:hypothetical protein